MVSLVGRRVLHRRLERLSALHGDEFQRRARAGLLDLGGDAEFDWLHDGGHKRCLHDLQVPCARHDLYADAVVLLDLALRRHHDDLRHAAAHGRDAAAGR